jgi:hypothetical protein
MNKRIEEFAAQCGFRSNPDVYDRNQSFDIPKFAELIVRECLNMIENEAAQYDEPVWAVELVNDITEHFGIKE